MNNRHRLILASQSPRRRELMEKTGIPFTVEVSAADESIPEGLCVEKTAEYLSGIKAMAVMEKHPREAVTVIGSDTIVVLDGRIFGKPADEEDAFRMLRELSGKAHEVLTGVTILDHEAGGDICQKSFTSVTKVKFYELSDEEIRAYIATGEPMDKAGAYGIQGLGVFFVEKIEGDYNTVVGFPLAETMRVLKAMEG